MRRTKARKKSAKSRSAKTVRPKTLSLDNLGMTSGVRVRASDGGGDSLGSSEVAPSDVEESGGSIGNGEGVSKGQGTRIGSGGQGTPGRGRPIPPKVIMRVKGKYPSSAPKLGRRIPVTLSLRVNDKGLVETARIVSKPASAKDYFDKAAIAAVRKTRFRPARQDGRAIPFSIRWTVFFDPPE